MIPVLYDSSETNTYTLNNGLGALPDAISCVVEEERNGAYVLTMKYPITGLHFEEIAISNQIKAIPFDGGTEQFFRIYKITKPLNGVVTVYAQHISYQLSSIPVSPFTARSLAATLQGFTTYAAESNPFTFWTDKSVTATYEQVIPESIRARLGGQEGSVLSVYGGEFEWDNYIVKLHNNRGENSGVALRYGKNIIDVNQEENINETYTGIYPYYYSEESGLVELPEKIIYSDTASNYPYHRTKPVDFSAEFTETPTESELRTVANRYISNNNIGYPSISINVSFVALWQTEEYKDIAPLERVHLCDTVTVEFEELGIDVEAKVIKTEYNVLTEKYNNITIGDARSNLASTISGISADTNTKISDSSSRLEKAIAHATELIRGGLGGYVVLNTNADGEPQEILIMDEDDIDTAQKIWRWNLGGLGYSNTGYSGTYSTAITQDGSIVADFITTGTLDANVVRTGLLTDVEGLNSWDLDTGEFTLNASATLGDDGPTVEEALSSITANAEAIELKVSKGDVSSQISVESDTITISGDRFILNSTNCSISEDGTITATNADMSGTLTSGTDTGKKIVISNGVITGYNAGVQQAALEIGDGLFNIIGKLALNGYVGVSGDTEFVKSISYSNTSLGNVLTGYTSLSFDNLTGVSLSSSITYVPLNVSVTGYVDGSYVTLTGSISVPDTRYTLNTTTAVKTAVSSLTTNTISYAKAVEADTGAITSKYGIIQSIS